MLWRIYNDGEPAELLYWSNTDGWVETGYEVFTDEEKARLNLPIDGVWVRAGEDDVATSPNSDPAEAVKRENAGSLDSEIPNWRVRCHLDLTVRAETTAKVEERVKQLLAEIHSILEYDGDDALRCERANIFGPISPILETAE